MACQPLGGIPSWTMIAKGRLKSTFQTTFCFDFVRKTLDFKRVHVYNSIHRDSEA